MKNSNRYWTIKWLMRSKANKYKKLLENTKKIIHRAKEKGAFIISWSAGKDSTAMTHIVKMLYPETPIVIQFDDCDWPDKKKYVERVANAQGWKYNVVAPDFSVWTEAKKFKIGFEELCSVNHPFTQKTFIELLENKRLELNCVGSFIGLRAKESLARRYNMAIRGDLYRLKSGVWHCLPMGQWEAQDVFAYLIENNIEINPCYFHNRFKDPEAIRLAYALPTTMGMRLGDMEHIRVYYPEQYRRLREENVI